MGDFLQINIFRIMVCIYVLCVHFCESTRIQLLFFECSNALHIWSWVRYIFLNYHFFSKDDLLSFIKSDGSPFVKLIELVVITFSIWMIWRISIIKDLTCLVGNSSKASMKHDMLDFNVINFFGINTRISKVLRPLPVRWEFPSSGSVKISIDGAVGDILVLLLVEVFYVGL